ncbi:hypothetical protein PENTCL1PPCAC_21063, partial [Pristionchus entomophagus]
YLLGRTHLYLISNHQVSEIGERLLHCLGFEISKIVVSTDCHQTRIHGEYEGAVKENDICSRLIYTRTH